MTLPQVFPSKKDSLKYSAIAGLISFATTLAITPFELDFFERATPLYILLVIINGVGAGFFSYGFFVLGEHLNNRLLQRAGFLWIALSVISTLVLLITISFEALWGNFFFSSSVIVMLGAGSLVLGKGLRGVGASFDKSAKMLGNLLIVTGVSMITLIFFLVGAILLIVFDILGALFLLRAREKLQATEVPQN